MIECESCGHLSPDELAFCGNCGRALAKPFVPTEREPEGVYAAREVPPQRARPTKPKTLLPAICLLIGIVVAVVFAAILYFLLFAPGLDDGGSSPPPSGQWTYVTTFSGSGDTTTDTFHCDNKCKFVWTVQGDPDWTYWYAFVFRPGGSIYVDQWDTDRPSTGTTYLYRSGDFYFDIGAANVDSWEIVVYDWE